MIAIYAHALYVAIFILLQLSLNSGAYALSPSFSNQEITDEAFNWIDVNKKALTSIGDPSIDIRRVDYLSDGNTLNSTIWLSAPIKISNDTASMAYGMVIDVDSNEKTGVQGADYQLEAKLQNGSSTRSFVQWSSLGQARPLSILHSNASFFENEKPYVSLSADLGALGFPSKYKVMFYSAEKSKDGSRWIADFTDWIHVPSPNFVISIPSINIRPGEEKNAGLQLTSDIDDDNAWVTFSVNQSNNDIYAYITPNETVLSPDGSTNAVLSLRSAENATARPYTMPINSTIFFPRNSTFEVRSSGISDLIIPASLKDQNITEESRANAVVLQPLTVNEQFNRFWITFSGAITSIVIVILVIFGYYFGFTKFSRVKNMYRRRIDTLYNSSSSNKDESLQHLRETRMEIMELFDKGNMRRADYVMLSNKVLQYMDKIAGPQK